LFQAGDPIKETLDRGLAELCVHCFPRSDRSNDQSIDDLLQLEEVSAA
jgi:hypothetical protein